MSSLIRKLAKNKAEQIGRISVGDTDFTLAVDGNLVLALVNGYRVADANLHQDPVPMLVPVLAALITKTFQKNWSEGAKVDIYEGEWDTSGKYPSKNFMDAMITNLSKTVGNSSIKLHKDGNGSSQKLMGKQTISFNQDSLVNNLNLYSQQISTCMKMAERLSDKAEVFSRVKLVKTTWGMDKIITEISNVKSKLGEIEKVLNELGGSVSLATKAAGRLQHRLEKNLQATQDDKKFIAMVLIPDIVVTFDKIKKSVIYLVTTLAAINNIEKLFKDYTGNPISWSMSSSLVEDFRESYSVLVDFLVDIPTIEMDVMEPLEVLQAKLKSREAAT